MSEHQIQLSGWQAMAGLVVLVLVLGVRLATFADGSDNEALMEQLELELTTEYFPSDVERLRVAVASGDDDVIFDVAGSVLSTKLDIESVKTSAPLFDFSSNQKVIVKATYSVKDANGSRDKGVQYYRFKHGVLTNSWQYKGESSALMYYLNFM